MSLTMADVLRRQVGRSKISFDGFKPKKSVARATSKKNGRTPRFGKGTCPLCGGPQDQAWYFSKRRHPHCKKCKADYMRNWRISKKLSPEARQKDNCRSYANQYLKRGKLKREPCKVCGSPESQMHHPDYSKPLEVEWMCRPCHVLEHHIERTRAALTSS